MPLLFTLSGIKGTWRHLLGLGGGTFENEWLLLDLNFLLGYWFMAGLKLCDTYMFSILTHIIFLFSVNLIGKVLNIYLISVLNTSWSGKRISCPISLENGVSSG